MGLIDADELISRIRYSSKYNEPCPEWVYKLIKSVGEMKRNETIDALCKNAEAYPLGSMEIKEALEKEVLKNENALCVIALFTMGEA